MRGSSWLQETCLAIQKVSFSPAFLPENKNLWQSSPLLKSFLLKAFWPALVTIELPSKFANIKEQYCLLVSLLHTLTHTVISATFFTASPLWPLLSNELKRMLNSEHNSSAAKMVCVLRGGMNLSRVLRRDSYKWAGVLCHHHLLRGASGR